MVAHKLSVFVLVSVAFSSVFAAPIGTSHELHDVNFGVPPTPEQLASLIANAEGIAATTPAGGILSSIAGQGLPALGGGLPKLPRGIPVGGQSLPAVGGSPIHRVPANTLGGINAPLPAVPAPGGLLADFPRGLPVVGGTGAPALPALPVVGELLPKFPSLPLFGQILPNLPRGLPVVGGTPGLPTPPAPPVVPGAPAPPGLPALPKLPLPLPGVGSGTGLTGAAGSNTVQQRDNKGGVAADGTVPNQLNSAEGQVTGTVGPVVGTPGQVAQSPKDLALGTAKGAASDLGVLQMGSSGNNGGVSVNGNNVSQ